MATKHRLAQQDAEPVAASYAPKAVPNSAIRDQAQYIASGRLYPVGVRCNLRNYLQDTWKRRAFIWTDSRAKVHTQNQQHRLGSWWLVIKPVIDVVFYWVLFGVVLKVSRGMENYTAYIVIGVLIFQYFSRALTQNVSVMLQSKAMMRAFYFPRIMVPLSLAVREALFMGPVILVIFLGLIVLPPHILSSIFWLLFIPVMGLNILFNLGLGLIIARYAYVIPDIGQLLGMVSRILLYGSAVIFPIERFINHPVVTMIIQANPIYIFIDLYRTILIDGDPGDFYHWGSLASWSLGLMLVGCLIFWRTEEIYGREFN